MIDTVSILVGERPRQARTISYETGIQNGPLSIAVAAASFPKPCYKGSTVSGGIGDIDAAVIPLLYSLFISVQSPFICLFFRYYLVRLQRI